jgi:hypothetical protein
VPARKMTVLNWIIEKYFLLISFIPAIWADELSGSFPLMRGLLGLVLLVPLVWLIASILRMRLGRELLRYFWKEKK